MEEFENELFLEEEHDEDPFWKKVLFWIGKVLIVSILIASVFYIYGGVRELFMFRETPQGIDQVETIPKIDGEYITLPLNVLVVRSSEEGSQLELSQIQSMVENASRIWNQGRIQLTVGSVNEISVTDEEANVFLQSPRVFLESVEVYDPSMINLVLIRRLSGINGIAFSGLNTTGVADLSSVFNFRVLAHEVGHILDLDHLYRDPSRLMHVEAQGYDLSKDEVEQARESARVFVDNQ